MSTPSSKSILPSLSNSGSAGLMPQSLGDPLTPADATVDSSVVILSTMAGEILYCRLGLSRGERHKLVQYLLLDT